MEVLHRLLRMDCLRACLCLLLHYRNEGTYARRDRTVCIRSFAFLSLAHVLLFCFSIFDSTDHMTSIARKAATDAALEDSDIKDSDSGREKASDMHVEDIEKDMVDV